MTIVYKHPDVCMYTSKVTIISGSKILPITAYQIFCLFFGGLKTVNWWLFHIKITLKKKKKNTERRVDKCWFAYVCQVSQDIITSIFFLIDKQDIHIKSLTPKPKYTCPIQSTDVPKNFPVHLCGLFLHLYLLLCLLPTKELELTWVISNHLYPLQSE